MQFQIGQRVRRRENRVSTGATILDADPADPQEPMYRLAYDEGGEGWWPQGALSAE